MPRPHESEFGQVAGQPPGEGDLRKAQSAAEVARLGLEGLAAGKHWVIPYLCRPGGGFRPAIRSPASSESRGRADVPAADCPARKLFFAAEQL